MRLRRIKNQGEKIITNELTINNPKNFKGQWNKLFTNEQPLWVEIGIGLGGYLSKLCKLKQDVNFVGIEKYSKVLVRALKRFDDEDTLNVRLIRFDAEELDEVFECGEVQRIMLNFSDPWPKRRHEGRRLTHPNFLKIYDKILSKNGQLHFKTDNDELFDYSVEVIKENNWKLNFLTYDLHAEVVENVMTEYETKFSSQGVKIKKLVATR
jgi:tRNA (guanine-N7-)-methyltransferase